MQPLALEWVAKAEGDFATARRELRAWKLPNYDAVCFHAQQYIEKYLKARLQESNVPFGRTHHLAALLGQLLPIEPTWDAMRPDLQALATFAVEVRYPGQSADKATAQEAFTLCRAMRRRLRESLGLPLE